MLISLLEQPDWLLLLSQAQLSVCLTAAVWKDRRSVGRLVG